MQSFVPQKGKNEGPNAPAKAHKPFFQTKLTVNAPGDAYEQEADNVADQVMRMPDPAAASPAMPFRAVPVSSLQRKCAACEHKEEEKVMRKEENEEEQPIQTKLAPDKKIRRKCAACEKEEEVHRKEAGPSGGQTEAPDIVSDVISGSGEPLDAGTQHFMGSRMGQDFSDVRIHTDSKAAESATSISALAYTSGNHIVFNSGQYQPGTDSGKRLLAHELTHVSQQTANVGRKPFVQRFYTFAPNPRPKGSYIHSQVLPAMSEANKSPHFFVEVAIPGANKKDVDKGKRGIADLYKGKTTIGIRLNEAPQFLKPDGKLLQGDGKAYDHANLSAPVGSKRKPTIRRMDDAPVEIEVGDLKPGGSGEAILGEGQVADYISGIKNTSVSVNEYLKRNPDQTDSTKKSWDPKPAPMKSLKIPDHLEVGSGHGIMHQRLSLYQDQKSKPVVFDTSLTGAMFVYKDQRAGIWSYEWIPDSMKVDYRHDKVDHALNRLNTTVIHNLVQTKKTSAPAKLPTANTALTIGQPLVARVQRKEKFKDEQWNTTYFKPWKEKEAEPLLKDKKLSDKTKIAEAVTQLGSRSQQKVKVPHEAAEHTGKMDKISHWTRFGRLYGWLREKFGTIFTKFQAFAKKVKDKAKSLRAKVSSSFGSWFKAAVKVVFKIIKMIGAWALSRVAEEILGSLQRGIQNNIAKVVEMFTPEGVKSKIEHFEDLKQKYETMLAEKEEELMEKFFGKKLKLLEELSELEKILSGIGTIVDLVKWGVRIVACLSPPLLGCLWNLAIAALEWAFSKLMETCWFSKKVFGPIMSSIDAVRDFPKGIAADIVTFANKHIPVPEGLDPLFGPINISESEFSMDCSDSEGAGGEGAQLSPQQEEIGKLIEEIGFEKFEAFLALAKARGVSPAVEMSAERLRKLKSALANLSKEALEKAATAPKGEDAIPLEAFLDTLKEAKPAEELAKPKENFHIEDYDRVKKKNRKHQAEIGWKPGTFQISGDGAGDEQKLAEAIYVIQQMLGLKADGIAGPETVMEYYEKNNLPADRIYRNAKQSEQNSRIKAVIKAGYPSQEQLLSDLRKLQFGRVGDGQYVFTKSGNNYIFWGKTAMGSRVGGYVKVFPIVHEKQKRLQVVDVSILMTLDAISSNDNLDFDIEVHVSDKLTSIRFGDVFLSDYPAHSVLSPPGTLIGGLLPSDMVN